VEHSAEGEFSTKLFHVEHSSGGVLDTYLFHVEQYDELESGSFWCSTWNNGRGFSPFWRLHIEKSQLEAFNLGGVPVFKRISLNPSVSKDSESLFTAGRLSPALSVPSLPIQIFPLKEVPEVMTTVLELMLPCSSVLTPTHCLMILEFSVIEEELELAV
jgi:hypothetical protein